jgi:ribosomal protein S18 acetylase RimI-like enzyme
MMRAQAEVDMHFDETELKAKDGRTFSLRSLEGLDAEMAIAFMGRIYAQSPYLSRYADEWSMSVEDERLYLERAHLAERHLMIGTFAAGELIAIADCYPMYSVSKMVHRCNCSIAIDRAFHGLGIGTAMMKVLIEEARSVGYEQMELEVVSENAAAIALYKKLGFVACGLLPHGFKNRDLSYYDLLSMVLTL